MKTWLKKGISLKSAALLALPVALLLVILGGTLNANPASAQTATGSVATDRAALVALYNATDGANWTNNTNWLSDQPLGQWHGVTTNDDGRVTRLDLSENNLSGPIPAELGDLSQLTELSLHRNQLTGQIPSWLADLDNLESLHLSRNQLTGEIPAFLGGMTSLSRLHLNHNGFTGAVPAELGNRTTLTSLLLQSNPGLTGKLPQSLTGLRNVWRVHFQDTGLCYPNGTNLARWIAGVRDVKGNDCDRAALVALYHATDGDNWHNNTNWLSDKPVGEWHGVYASGSRVRNLFLKNNNLSGPMPPELGYLNYLGILDLQNNSLTGEIPPEMTNLQIPAIFLNDNNLSGRLPSGLFDKFEPRPNYLSYSDERFKDLDLRNNRGMYGPLPRSLILARPIFSLFYTGTGLCAPGDAEFQTELNNLPGIIGAPGTELTNLVTLDQNCTDRQILTAFYEDTGGPNWNNKANWLSDQPLNQWHGVTTNDAGRVTHLNLAENNLTGKLPDYLASLTELTELSLRRNNLSGQIPTQLTQFERLEHFHLSRNKLTGELPAGLGRMKNLSRLHLNDNGFTGAVPTELGNLTNLTSLLLYANAGLSGELPLSLTGLSKLTSLRFNSTGLCAPLNDEFQQWLGGVSDREGKNCTEREYLVWLYNATNGENWTNNTNWLSDKPLDQWHGVTTDANGRVTSLGLARNKLSGSLPAELSRFDQLNLIDFHGNRLTGPIPAGLGSLSNLKTLSLFANDLTGSIPAELGSLTNLQYLFLDYNRLSGEVPTELGNLSNLQQLYLSHTDLSGALPGSLTGLSQLTHLHFGNSGLCAPADAGFQTWLKELSDAQSNSVTLDQNCTDRQILTALYHATNGGNWTNNANWLSDQPLSEWHGVVTNADERVVGINLQGNNLSGKIPTGLGSLSKLDAGLNLHTNNLTGSIPADLGNLSVLRELSLFGNSGLNGPLPQSFTELNNIWRLRYINTGLCAPSNDAFQNWLEGKWPEESYPGDNASESATFNGDRNCDE